jgi:putative lipoic acid-binding regulatory protein
MFGDFPIEKVIEYLEQHERNELGLKITDKHVVVDFIRPVSSFDLTCKFQHKVANHLLNRILVRSHHVDTMKYGSWRSSVEGNYDSWSSSAEGWQLLQLEMIWRDANHSDTM